MTRPAPLTAALLMLMLSAVAHGGSPAPGTAPGTAPGIPAIPDRLGVVHVGGRYHFAGDDFLNEGADRVLALGSRVIKVYLTLNTGSGIARAYRFQHWPDCHSLVELAKTEPFRKLFAKPFTTFVLTVFRPGVGGGYWRDGLTADEEAAETRAFEDLTRYLLTTYAGTGKTFVLQNWEGDWACRRVQDPKRDPDPAVWGRMIRWLAARQRGVDLARKSVHVTGVRVLNAAEVNLVKIGMTHHRPCVTTEVLPHVPLDLVSYSSYDTQQNPATLRRALDFIAAHMMATPGSEAKDLRHRVYLGEFGLPENQVTPERFRRVIGGAMDAALDWGCPYVIYWELYCNEPIRTPVKNNADCRGFWLIRPDGSRSEAWELLHAHLLNPRG